MPKAPNKPTATNKRASLSTTNKRKNDYEDDLISLSESDSADSEMAETDTDSSEGNVEDSDSEDDDVAPTGLSDSESEYDNDEDEITKKNNKKKQSKNKRKPNEDDDIGEESDYESEIDVISDSPDGENNDDDDDEPIENYLQKINDNMRSNIITDFHPQLKPHNYEEISLLTKIQRNRFGDIVDDLHRTSPFMTKYECTRILAERTTQINLGMQSFLEDNAKDIMDGFLIAKEEFKQKKIPFIVKRPLPNGAFEYWKASDLEII
jgi:DNA-directed RNA polymerase I, II, and III subunit RPABC2